MVTSLEGQASADGLVDFALRVARASTAERVSFHAGYRSVAVDPGIDYLSVITELRRLVLLAEMKGDDWRDARDAADALAPYRGRITVDAGVRFHPQNGYTVVPRLDVHLASPSAMQPAVDVRVEPIFATLPGWQSSTLGTTELSSLPTNARRYVDFLSQQIGVEIGLVSTGPERSQTIIVHDSALGRWLRDNE